MSQETGTAGPAIEYISEPRGSQVEAIALALRLGLSFVILWGGLNKLLQLLDPARQGAMVEQYLGPVGYINTLFVQYLFEGPLGDMLTPWAFLTVLSGFEFISGLLLLAGIFVRPLALVWGILFWSFVAALPVATAAGVDAALETHRSPALLVMIRDIGLSGLFFAQFALGSGAYSADRRLFGTSVTRTNPNWDVIGVLIRFSIALPLLVGGAFAGYGHIQTFGVPGWLLLVAALPLLLNVGGRVAGALAALIFLWFIIDSVDLSRSIVGNFNAVKREFGFLAASIVLARHAGGDLFSVRNLAGGWRRIMLPGEAASHVTQRSTYTTGARAGSEIT